MSLKSWWKRRQAKHYLKSHWHLIADVILMSLVLELIVALLFIYSFRTPKVDTSTVEHVTQDVATSTTTTGSLVVKSSITKSNIYSGQAFTVKVNLENNGKNNISGVELIPVLDDGFTISKLENVKASSSVKVQGRKLVLENLSASSSEDFEVLVTISAYTGSPRMIHWRLNTTYQEAGKTNANVANLSDLKLITDLKIKAVAYYNSPLGDQLGSGPIPPVLGLPTNYWVFFEIDKFDNDLTGLAVTAKLPTGVTLSNRKTLSAGEFTYNEGQKRLTWLVKEMSVKNGLYQVGFEVQLFPTSTQLNTSPLLVSNISYLATDAYTGQKLSGSLPAIDTKLPADIINIGQGTVTN